MIRLVVIQQPFTDLIAPLPRPETAASVSHLLERLFNTQASTLPKELKVLDLCTGTGCISLLFAHLFLSKWHRAESLKVLGVDISPVAVKLAIGNRNSLAEELPMNSNVEFVRADILRNTGSLKLPGLSQLLEQNKMPEWDIIISNPPYISPAAFNRDTTRSVRNFEPKLALVPSFPSQSLSDQEQGDMFYPRLLEIAENVSAKILLMEVADLAQAKRVSSMVKSSGAWDGVEIWRDNPDVDGGDKGRTPESVDGVEVIGKGDGRCVFCWKGLGASWLEKL